MTQDGASVPAVVNVDQDVAKVSAVVKFGDSVAESSEGVVLISLDKVKNIDGEGKVKSSFFDDESAYVFLYHTPDLRCDRAVVSSGSVSYVGEVKRDIEEDFVFDSPGAVVDLDHAPIADPQALWFGRSGVLTLEDRQVKCMAAPAIGSFKYSCVGHLYKVDPPAKLSLDGEKEWLLRLVFNMERV